MARKKDRAMHPADAERKKQRKKDIAANKKKREQVRPSRPRAFSAFAANISVRFAAFAADARTGFVVATSVDAGSRR